MREHGGVELTELLLLLKSIAAEGRTTPAQAQWHLCSGNCHFTMVSTSVAINTVQSPLHDNNCLFENLHSASPTPTDRAALDRIMPHDVKSA